MIGNILLAPISLPLRLLSRIFSFLFKPFRIPGATTRKAAAGPVSGLAVETPVSDPNALPEEDDTAADIQNGASRQATRLFFKRLPRPRLAERNASDLTLDGAREFVRQSQNFYSHEFPLFPSDELFYEEVEQAYLEKALGADLGSIDNRFIGIVETFRKGLNDNTRLLFFIYAPLVFMAFLAAAAFMVQQTAPAALLALAGDSVWAKDAVLLAAPFVAALGLLLVLYKWPYEVTQTQNLLGLDNYITNKFARINHNFQVAKRKGLNVEREKRFSQLEELKEEAGAWTTAYHWLGYRLLLCEKLIRNMIFQVRRNTALYVLGSQALSIALAVAVGGLFFTNADMALIDSAREHGAAIVAAGGLYLLIAYGIVMRGAFKVVHNVLEQSEWARFYTVNLPQSIADHVGEDKVQIVTFRDRNRVEG